MATRPDKELKTYYFVRYTAHHNEDKLRSVLGHIFLSYPDSPTNIIIAIKNHVRNGRNDDGSKRNPENYTIIIDAMSVISAVS